MHEIVFSTIILILEVCFRAARSKHTTTADDIFLKLRDRRRCWPVLAQSQAELEVKDLLHAVYSVLIKIRSTRTSSFVINMISLLYVLAFVAIFVIVVLVTVVVAYLHISLSILFISMLYLC